MSSSDLADRRLRRCVGQLFRYPSPELISAVQTHDRFAAAALQEKCPEDLSTDMAPRAAELFLVELPSESQHVQEVCVVVAEDSLRRFDRKLSGEHVLSVPIRVSSNGRVK